MDKRIVVVIDTWPATSHFPLGHYTKTLGVVGDRITETDVLLIEHDIPTREFSSAVMACLPRPDYNCGPDASPGRVDLRHLTIVSVDPPGCKVRAGFWCPRAALHLRTD